MPITWEFTVAEFHSVYFDTKRTIEATYEVKFDTNRKVETREDELLGGPSLAVSWIVEPQLPLEVDDTNWEGGGNSWSHIVFDHDGRPEQYAQIDFEKNSKLVKTFNCDSRGRITLKIPDDIKPGIYTFRERGPSMAPRTTRDFVIVDPWMVYAHGKRHSASGADPVYGITKEQIADNANIHPSQVAGAASLGELIDLYGSNIHGGLEKNVSSGHGYYVVEGLGASAYSDASMTIAAGVCWEDSRLRKVLTKTVSFPTDGNYRIYVLSGNITSEKRANFPPKTTPLYSVLVSGGQTVGTITDSRLIHPPDVPMGTVNPVKWGAETTDDLTHQGAKLTTILSNNLDEIRNRRTTEQSLRNEFFSVVNNNNTAIELNQKDRSRAREALLSVGFATTMKQLYSYFNKKAADNLLLDNSSELIAAGMSDVANYLSSISTGGFNLKSSHVSAFAVGDELSSLTSLVIKNSIATLPNNWTSGTQYTLRTLRVQGPPAKYLDFHLVYEDTDADFKVLGSQSNEGRYIPQTMLRIKTVKDDKLKGIFNTTRNCYIDTYRTIFTNAGDESTIELLCVGGQLPDGVRLRGFSIVTA